MVKTWSNVASDVAATSAHVEEQGLSGADPLFRIPRRTIQKEHKRACGLTGITGCTIHDHRHTAAVHLARAGMPLHLLQQQLGHTNIDMTMRYARFHPDYGDVGEYFRRVGERLGLEGGDPPEREEAVERAAELLGVDAEALAEALEAGGPERAAA